MLNATAPFSHVVSILLPGIVTWQIAVTLALLTILASMAAMATYSLTCLPTTIVKTQNQRGVYPSTVRKNLAFPGFVMTLFFVLFLLACRSV
jgi:hypothetical protein